MTYTIRISLWYNFGGENPLAIPEAPELGEGPHAQAVMKHYGITYTAARPSPMADDWTFLGCDKYPTPTPRWMTVRPEGKQEGEG